MKIKRPLYLFLCSVSVSYLEGMFKCYLRLAESNLLDYESWRAHFSYSSTLPGSSKIVKR